MLSIHGQRTYEGALIQSWPLTPLVWTRYSVDMGKKPPANPELLPGTLYLLILRILRSGPLHGYAIAKRIKDASHQGLDIEDGSLYPSLNRMLVKGWLAAEWGISENNRKARFYRLTPEGRKQLTKEADDFDRLVRSIQLVMRTAE
jgi:PadR family transcriptional regulator PadR